MGEVIKVWKKPVVALPTAFWPHPAATRGDLCYYSVMFIFVSQSVCPWTSPKKQDFWAAHPILTCSFTENKNFFFTLIFFHFSFQAFLNVSYHFECFSVSG